MFLFGAAYYPEHRDPARWAFDLDRMAAAHINALRPGEFAWCRFEPSEGQDDFDWLDRSAGLALPRGIRLVLCPPLRTAPAWLAEARISPILAAVLPPTFSFAPWQGRVLDWNLRT